MKKITLIGIFALSLITLLGFYLFSSVEDQHGDELTFEDEQTKPIDHKNISYTIDGVLTKLTNGFSEKTASEGSTEKVITKYYGNEQILDINADGLDDRVFLLTRTSGGSGTFFYIVAAINTSDGWLGSQAYLLGDRILPQTISLNSKPAHQNVIVVKYLDRKKGEAMSEAPSSLTIEWLILEPNDLSFGIVEQNFVGEADVNRMNLGMQSWTWVRTLYNNDTELVPKSAQAFSLVFLDNGVVHISTDCNSIRGSYTLVDNQLTFGSMAATKMFCEDSQEQAFSTMLAKTHSYMFTSKGELVLMLKYDSGSAIFR